MRLAATLALIALLPLAAEARCLDATSIDRGVVFKRQTGDAGFAQRRDGRIEVSYVTGRAGVEDDRITRFGIYETARDDYPWGPDMVGMGTIRTETSFARKGPEPEPGLAFQTTWKAKISDFAPVEDSPITSRRKGTVTYLYQAVKEVKLSGCTYRAMAVEGTFQDGNGWRKQRWIYFPDLGFGLETRVTTEADDRKLGLTALRPPK